MSGKQARLAAPPPPPGFVLMEDGSQDSDIPAPPPGFVMDEAPPQESYALRRSLSISQGFADLATFGLADEAAAAVGTLGGMLPGGHGKGYSQLLEEIRGQSEANAEAHPYAHLTGQVMGGVGGAVGLAKGGLSLAANAAQAGKGLLPRLAGGAADGGTMAGLYGFGSGEGTQDRVWNAARNVPYGMAAGAAGEGIATGMGSLARRVFRGASDAAPGVNPAANVAAANEFGIPLSRAQATRSVKQTAIEDQLRASGQMADFDARARDALVQSTDDMQGRLAGTGPRVGSPDAAFENVPGALRGKRDRLKAASRDAYDASVNNPNVLVSGEAVDAIPGYIRQRLDADQILIDPMYHQGAARAMSYIDDFISRMPKPGGDIRSVQAQLRWIENMRAGVRKNFPPIGQDAPALKAISSALDEWTDEVFERGLVSADDDVLSSLKEARSKWSEYKSMAEPRAKTGGRLNPRYEAQAKVRAIMDKDMSPDEVGRYLFGSSVAVPPMKSHLVVRELREHLGPDSPEWSAIRQSFWLRATRAGDDVLNPSQIAKNLDGFLNGGGKSVSTVLFNEQERQLMRSYLGVMRSMTSVKAGINNSNTANRMLPMLQRYATTIMGALASGGGMASGLGPLESMGVGAVTAGIARGAGAAARQSRLNAATRMPVPAMPSGTGGALLRGGSVPMVIGQEPRRPLEITVGRPAG